MNTHTYTNTYIHIGHLHVHVYMYITTYNMHVIDIQMYMCSVCTVFYIDLDIEIIVNCAYFLVAIADFKLCCNCAK